MSNRTYIETCPIIDVIKGRVRVPVDNDRLNDIWYVEACLKAALAGEIEVVTSMLTIAECKRARQEKPPTEEMKRLIRSVLASGKIFHLAEVTQTIAEAARDLEWEKEINLKGADAIHVATAIKTGCKEFFTTDGRGPLKYAAKIEKEFGLKVIRASETQLLPADYRQGKLLKGTKDEET